MTSTDRPRFLFLRALLAFLVMPGMVAFVIPLLLAPRQAAPSGLRWIGMVLVVAGTFLLLWCVRDFYVAGKGTLAPWTPPRDLVVTGLYRWSRNPMYLAVTLILLGWTIWFLSWALLWYALAVPGAFHLRVVFFEEPWLAQMHGEAWRRYRARVPRWLGRVQPADGEG
ncbi:MAG TPA: isoprenylcysteine carboxylmethyltransferase family protein [Gemmatimonadaceae bacterium]|nr:isoprenylcysteine carboxylmethyltransferase family protein [Gemmatimonadaceae bacterium]